MESKNLVFEGVTLDQLKMLITDCVRTSYSAVIRDLHDEVEQEDLMTIEQTAKFLKINKSTLYYWTKKGKVNSYGICNRRYYKKSEILECLNQYCTKVTLD